MQSTVIAVRRFMGPVVLECRVELVEETHVVLEIEAQVFHAVFEHRDAFNTHAEGEARVFFGVYAVCPQYVGVNHAAAHDFEPAGTLAHRAALAPAEVARYVDLGRRFGEGEI